MPRTARCQPGGMVFHVLNRGNARMQIFDKPADYNAFERVMVDAAGHVNMRVLAYCLMPNHWHLVLRPREAGDMGRFMQRLTVTHVRRWHEKLKVSDTILSVCPGRFNSEAQRRVRR